MISQTKNEGAIPNMEANFRRKELSKLVAFFKIAWFCVDRTVLQAAPPKESVWAGIRLNCVADQSEIRSINQSIDEPTSHDALEEVCQKSPNLRFGLNAGTIEAQDARVARKARKARGWWGGGGGGRWGGPPTICYSGKCLCVHQPELGQSSPLSAHQMLELGARCFVKRPFERNSPPKRKRFPD